MKLNKKLTSLFILSASLLGIVACGAPTSSNPGSSVPPSTTPSIPVPGDEETTILDALDPNRPSGEDFDYSSDYEPLDPPEPVIKVELPVDPAYGSGAATTKYRMEAECADIHYQNDKNDITKDTFTDYYNTAFSHLLSNNLATRNLNNCPDSHLTFKFTSNKAYKVKLNIMISAWDEKRDPFVVGDYIEISNSGTFNNEKSEDRPDLSKLSFAYADAVALVGGGDVNDIYWRFKEVQTEICVYEGQNELVINMIGAGGANIDYIELDSSATFNGFDNNHYNDDTSRWYISTKPTETTTGVITVEREIDGAMKKYSYGLPAIKDENGKVNSLYTEKIVDGMPEYSFKVKNQTLKISYNSVTTITLKDYPKVKFANGTATLTKPSGSTLTYADFALCDDDRKVSNFDVFGADDKRIGSAIPDSYVIPDENISLKALTYIRDGFKLLDPGSEQSDRLPQRRAEGAEFDDNLFTNSSTNNQVIKGGENGYDETGVVFGYNGTLPKGGIFRVNTVVGSTAVITMGKPHQWAYTFENKGSSKINFRFNQVNSGAMIEPNDEGVLVDLEPGESMQFVITMSFANGSANKNALSIFTVLSDCQNMKLGFAMSCKLAN